MDENLRAKILRYNTHELNNLKYEDALKCDKRTYLQYYLSLLFSKNLFLSSFFFSDDYNSRIIKIHLFFFTFSINYSVNALFFNDETMHQIYVDGGSFNFIYQIPQIIISSAVSILFNILLNTLALSQSSILSIKTEKNIKNFGDKAKKIVKSIHTKFILFFIIGFFVLLLFWYYLSSFCAIYKNTQLHLIKDTAISFGLGLVYPLGIYLLPGIFRIYSLNTQKHDREFIYKFSLFLQML